MSTPPLGPPTVPGSVIAGRYELVSELGRGGMATVWRARDRVLQRDVAVKLFDAAGAMPDATARAAAEVRLLAGLHHPNLVAVFDAVGTTDDTFDVLVMELVDGRTLRQRLDEGPLTPADTARLGADLAAGLAHVHARGIVHRDIKPANVLLENGPRGPRVKLADFGVARLLEGAALTMAGTTVGTANYLSPEQATGSTVGPPSDVYGLGLVLLECLTGELAYPGHGIAAASARLHRPPHIPDDLDPRWRRLLASATALDPSARPSAEHLEAELRVLGDAPFERTQQLAAADSAATTVLGAAPVHGAGTAVLPSAAADAPAALITPTSQREQRRRRFLWPVVGAVAAVLVVVLALALFAGSRNGSTTPSTTPSAPSTPAAGAASRSSTSAATSPSAAPTSAASSASTRRTTGAPTPAPGPGGKNKGPSGRGGPGGSGKGSHGGPGGPANKP